MSLIENERNRRLTLPLEDGNTHARVLPFDEQYSQRPFETATFGLG